MYGSIYGDLAGSIYEFEQLKEIKSIDNGGYLSDKSFFSDDTILTVAVCAAIKDDKDYDKYLRKYIIDYMDYKPDFHPYFRSSFSPNLIKWAKSDLEGHSQGNGAMMRISPVGFLFDSEDEVIENAKLATIPSHNSEEAIDSATKIALVIFYLRKGYSKEEVFNMLDINVKYTPFKKFNTTCSETIDNCLYAFYCSNSFIDAMQKTLLMGGDTDTNCAIVGGMAEACYGMDNSLIQDVNKKIPTKFVKVLNRK
ncbi:MAG: ADP-ribosylglycohydrolase family protein [Bacilli bacterium]|nr:ADP-ribosylglycohydrolase family protein [Bacilli bacterium]